MSITRPSTLTPEEMDRLLENLANRGARITMTDPRVTSVQTWVISSVGIGLIGLGGYLVNSVNRLNETMTRVVTQNEYRDRQMADALDRIRALERRP